MQMGGLVWAYPEQPARPDGSCGRVMSHCACFGCVPSGGGWDGMGWDVRSEVREAGCLFPPNQLGVDAAVLRCCGAARYLLSCAVMSEKAVSHARTHALHHSREDWAPRSLSDTHTRPDRTERDRQDRLKSLLRARHTVPKEV